MAKKKVFYSFHFDNDVMRVQLVRNIGALEGNEPIKKNEWEEVKKKGSASIEKWISDNMKDRECVVVLVGSETHERPWVIHEIKKAWADGKGLVAVHIHNLKCARAGLGKKGTNPFSKFTFKDKNGNVVVPKCHDPLSTDAYKDISENLESWINAAIAQRK